MDLPESLAEVDKSVVSKDGFDICRAIKDGDNPSPLFVKYGWKETSKREKIGTPTDSEFFIFKGKRKEEGPFNEEYGLAWSP